MLKYDKIEVSEGTNVSKTDGLRECIICDHWSFLAINFKLQPTV